MSFDSWIVFLSSVAGQSFLYFGPEKTKRKFVFFQNFEREIFFVVQWVPWVLVLLLESAAGVCFLVLSLTLFLPFVQGWASFWKQQMEIRIHFSWFIDDLIVAMSSGKSFKNSLNQNHEKYCEEFQKYLLELRNSVLFMQHFRRFSSAGTLNNYFSELVEVANCGIQQKKRLRFLRNKYQLEEYFRRRSVEKLFLIGLQVSFLLVIYVFLLCFFIYQGGLFKFPYLLALSFGLFLAGLAMIFYLLLRRRII